MGDREALLAAVVADPADDLPRLVFADWCDDHGDPDRAEFIRVQIELARRHGGRDMTSGWMAALADSPLAHLTYRQKVLASRCMRSWLAELPTPPRSPRWEYASFERGFATTLYVSNGRALRPELFAAAPVVRLRVAAGAQTATLAESVPVGRLRTLGLDRLAGSGPDGLLNWIGATPIPRIVVRGDRLDSAVVTEWSIRLGDRLVLTPTSMFRFADL